MRVLQAVVLTCLIGVLTALVSMSVQADDKPKDAIVGVWEVQTDQGKVTVEFKKDGTVVITSAGSKITGKYRIDGETMEVEMPAAEKGKTVVWSIPAGAGSSANNGKAVDPQKSASSGAKPSDDKVTSLVDKDKKDTKPAPRIPPRPRPIEEIILPGTGADVEGGTPLVEVDKEMQERIKEAIKKGVEYLMQIQGPEGSWPPHKGGTPGGNFPLGYTTLPGLTLLECGVDRKDDRVQKAAEFARTEAKDSYATYQISLTILFLDRLGDPQDVDLIRTLGLRLIAGQRRNGGWTYESDPQLSDEEYAQVSHGLKDLQPKPVALRAAMQLDKPPESNPRLPTTTTQQSITARLPVAVLSTDYRPPSELKNEQGQQLTMSPSVMGLPVFSDPNELKKEMEAKPGDKDYKPPSDTDNSNTQFAILALLAASKKQYDLPLDRTFALMVMRFQTSQNKDGSWHYKYKNGGHLREDLGHEPMTAVGLLALAVGHGMANDLWAAAPGQQRVQPAFKDKMDDEMVNKGFKALSKHVKEPSKTSHLPSDEVMKNLYYLWSVERVGVLFQQKEIEGKQWYPWGAEFLLATQQPDGNWKDGRYHDRKDMVDTCFALLFLKQANLAKALTNKLPSFQLGGPGD